MDKTEFLTELKRYLSVLDEREQKDILDEYAQHIDMKIQRGMSEAEAIGDFGSVEELAAEILEAYHVNPQYSVRARLEPGQAAQKLASGSAGALRKLLGWCRRFGSWCGQQGKRVWKGLGNVGRTLWCVVRKPFTAWTRRRQLRLEGLETGGEYFGDSQAAEAASGMTALPEESRILKMTEEMCPSDGSGVRMTGARAAETGAAGLAGSSEMPGAARKRPAHKRVGQSIQSGGRMIGGAGLGLWRGLWKLAGFVVRVCWNCGVIFLALCVAGCTLFCLYGLGVLAVLLAQGYPLAGVTIGCLGVVMCGGSLTAASLCLLWRKPKPVLDNRSESEEEEVSEHA